ncbi:MAG TPA: hypothetical protein VFX49_14030 [Chloroflexota bacterium]|nr:hypothetical protein [Chloroflexota bacterium]
MRTKVAVLMVVALILSTLLPSGVLAQGAGPGAGPRRDAPTPPADEARSGSGAPLAPRDPARDARRFPSDRAADPEGSRPADARSQSPFATVPENLRELPKIVPPPPKSGAAGLSSPTEIEVYDVATRASSRLPDSIASAESSTDGVRKVEGYKGLIPGGESTLDGRADPESIIGADDRVQITNTTDFPWRTVVNITSNFPSGSGGCTGEMIDSFHLFTAGHCVHDGVSWANSMQVWPGRSGASMPYNYAWATYFRSYTAWTVNQDHEHDWAVVTLDRPIGSWTGWMGRGTWTCNWPYIFGFGCDGIYGGTWNNAGYPDLAPGGASGADRMYFDADSGQKANANNHWYYNDTRPGNSGGPVWYYDGTNRYIGTIHAYGDDGSGANHGTRLNQDKFDQTNAWLAADAPNPPPNRADLFDDGQAFLYAGPTTVRRGQTVMNVGSDVRNFGTGGSGFFWVDYFLSSNTFISTSDWLICFHGVSNVPASMPWGAWENSDCSGTVPANIPLGTYYFGALIDTFNDVAEYDEGNNQVYKIAYQITVLPAQYTLAVTKAGTGAGTVTSSPAGINCGADCSELYNEGTVVNLTAVAAAGSVFTGWSGACAGTGACSVTMNAAKGVTATFQPARTLTVQKAGNGNGTVTSNPAGINCPGDCTENYGNGTVVTLTAAAAAGSSFTGWNGACSGKLPTCSVTMDASKSVKATFKLNADLRVIKSDSPDPVTVGGTLTYTITVTNLGPNNTSGVKVNDTLPSSLVYLSSSASQGTITTTTTSTGATKVTLTGVSLASGASATLTISVRPTVAGTLKNVASATTSVTFDPVAGNNKGVATTTVSAAGASASTSMTTEASRLPAHAMESADEPDEEVDD